MQRRSIRPWAGGAAAVLGLAALVACAGPSTGADAAAPASAPPGPAPEGLAVATFAGGCFWCMEPPFEKLDEVYTVVSGYAGGSEVDPAYEEVSGGRTGHHEAVEIRYDPEVIGYATLLEVFWRSIDPTDPDGQFADRGSQYKTAIFVHDDDQRRLAVASKAALEGGGRFDRPIVTPILSAGPFYPAEEHHQDYHRKNPDRYNAYRVGSGRAGFLERAWAGAPPVDTRRPEPSRAAFVKPSREELQRRLTPLQYHVTQENGTERPFDNQYWDNEGDGIYIDVVSGEPLFSSRDQFHSGTGWPSFTRPLEPANVVEREDRSLFMVRTEVRSRGADSHLGHLFDDGPPPTGLRYCINSAALRFVPQEDLEREGYAAFLGLFEEQR